MSGWCPIVFTTVPQEKVFDFWEQLIPSHVCLKKRGNIDMLKFISQACE